MQIFLIGHGCAAGYCGNGSRKGGGAKEGAVHSGILVVDIGDKVRMLMDKLAFLIRAG